MPCGELVGVDTPERVAEENRLWDVEKCEESFDISEVVFASIGRGMAGVAVTTLVGSDNAVLVNESAGEPQYMLLPASGAREDRALGGGRLKQVRIWYRGRKA
jgi:hypothetical protein